MANSRGSLAEVATLIHREGDAGRLWRVRMVEPSGPEWCELLSRSEHLLFHEPVWSEIIRPGFNAETCALVFENDGRVESGVMGFHFRSLWTRLLYLGFPYGGVVGDAPSASVLSVLLRQVAEELGISRIRFTDCPELPPVHPEGFDRVETRTHVLDLSGGDYESLWKGFKSRIRRDVRKAERSGVEVEEATTNEGIEVFYDLYVQSMRRNRAVPKYGIALVRAIFERLQPLGRCKILIARRQGEAVAGILTVDSASMSHYLMGGSSTEGLKYCPNDLLLHVAIRNAVTGELKGFDFLPSGAEDDALERFKSKWGAEAQPIDVHSAVTQPVRMAAWDLAYRVAETRLGAFALGAVRGRTKGG